MVSKCYSVETLAIDEFLLGLEEKETDFKVTD
jgi:hypothetical protein